jgi:uncharacterized protein involved in outer membrane biogenesis
MRKRRAIRWSIVLLAALIAILAIAYLAIPPIVEPHLARKLQAMVAERLHAELAIGDLEYRIPYTLHVHTARLLLRDHNDVPALLSVDELDLTLAELPRHGKPLVIRALHVHHPKVSMVRASTGELIGHDIVVKEPPKEHPQHKLSEMFELRKFKIDDGEINFEDRTKPGEPAMVWTGISTDLNITPKDKALYDYHFVVNNDPLFTLDAGGAMQIDELKLQINKLSMHAAVASEQSKTPLPAVVQRVVDKFKIKGELQFDGDGTLPLREMAKAQGKGHLQLHGASAQLKDVSFDNLSLDLVAKRDDSNPPTIDLASSGRVGDAPFQLDKSTVQYAGRAFIFKDMHARYGQDDIKLVFARILPDHPTMLVDLVGQVDFRAPSPPYPPPLSKAIARLNPTGTYHVIGSTSLDKPVSKTDLTVSAVDARLSPAPKHLPFEHVHGEFHIDEKHMELRNVTATLAGGDVTVKGTIDTPRPHAYSLDATAAKVNLEQLAPILLPAEKEKGRLRGEVYGKATIKGSGRVDEKSALDLMTVDGELESHESDLWQGNVVSGVVGQLKVSRNSLSTSEAAAIFSIKDRVIELKHAAINSPLLGLQGSGTVSFDKQLDLDVVAAPLGDWKMNLKKLKIPIVSDVTGEIAGAVQRLLTAATSTLLYQFQVTGETSKPKITPVPVPVLTEPAAALFGKMTRDQNDQKLIDLMREKKEEKDSKEK